MTPLVYTGETLFCLTLLTYLFAAFIGTVCLAMSIYYKLKPQYALPETAVSALSVLLFCGMADGIKIRYFGANAAEFSASPCFMPVAGALSMGVTLFVLAVLWIVLVAKKRLSGITAMSVKEAIAALSSGLCFYDETGRVLLLNDQIDGECRKITAEPLYDGKAFWDSLCKRKVEGGISVSESEGSIIVECADGRATCYKRIVHEAGGKTVYELSGTDVTEELALKKETEQKNENLKKMNLRLRKYGEIVEEVTREREILSARVKVHSNLGSLILRTKKALSQGEYDRKTLISEWNDIMSLIFASDSEEDKFSEAERTAASVGVRIFYDGKLPKKGTAAERIFATAVFECVVNVARHADGTELYAKFSGGEAEEQITVTNNGKQPTEEIREGGGLSSLRRMAENAGGRMELESLPQFILKITIPKEDRANER